MTGSRLVAAPHRPRFVAVLVALGLAVAVVVSGFGAGTATAGARVGTAPGATTAADPTIVLGSITPVAAGPLDPVTVTGTVVAGTAPLTKPVVRVLQSSQSVDTRADVQSWSSGSGAVAGVEVGRTRLSAAIPAGGRVGFTVTVPGGQFWSIQPFGAIPIAIEVLDTAAGAATGTGAPYVLRTFLGWERTKEFQPLSLAVVAPVTLPANAGLYTGSDSARLALWQAALGPASRIAHVLDGTDASTAAGPVPVTWAVDPAVFGPPSPSPATGQDILAPATTPLVTRITAGAANHALWALPYADPDVAASVTANPADPGVAALVRRSGEVQGALGVPATAGIAWPADGGLPTGREAGLKQAYGGSLRAVLVSSSAVQPPVNGSSVPAVGRTAGGTTVLAWDDRLTQLASRTTSPAAGALAAQEAVAELAMIVRERPGETGRTALIALQRQLDPSPAALRGFLATVAGAPWVSMTTTAALQQAASAATEEVTRQGTWPPAGPSTLTPARLAHLDDERTSVAAMTSVLGADAEAYRQHWTDVVDQQTSTRWREAPRGVALLEGELAGASAQATSGIRVADQTTNFLADDGILQVTVINDLPTPIDDIRLVLSPTNPRLRVPEQPGPFRVEASSKAVIPVRVQAVAAGLVPVLADLTTADGTPIGQGATITVRANPPSPLFYVISGIVVGLILLLGVWRAVRRPKGKARAGAAVPEAAVPQPVVPQTDQSQRERAASEPGHP